MPALKLTLKYDSEEELATHAYYCKQLQYTFQITAERR